MKLFLNNYQEFKKFIQNLDHKPKLLIHCCCGPCSTHTLEVLKDYFEITLFFDNDNIDTLDEFDLRLKELNKVRDNLSSASKIVIKDYEPKRYYEAVKGYEHLGEFSKRCYNCINLRMSDSAKYAKENGFDFFTTTLSISPYKSSSDINEIGYRLQDEYDIPYLYSNFKKENGYQDSIRLSKELGLYRQDYCGCIYSKLEREEKEDGNKIKDQ